MSSFNLYASHKLEYTYQVTGLFKNRKCQGTQHRLGWCSAMILPNLSHFHNVKKMVQGVWNIFCLVQAVMEGPKWPIFWDPAPFFLPYKNDSNLVESLLSTISSFAEIPGIFDFWKDQLTTIAMLFTYLLTWFYYSFFRGPPFKHALLNFAWFLLLAIEQKESISAFSTLVELYKPSLQR